MSDSAQRQPEPAPASAPGRTNGKTAGKIDRTIGKRRTAAGRKRKAIAPAAGAPLAAPPKAALPRIAAHPRAIGMPQPQPAHRMRRTMTGHIAEGIDALTESFNALCSTFLSDILGSSVKPTEAIREKWTAHLRSSIDLAMPSPISKAA